jgi:hypothetical protein
MTGLFPTKFCYAGHPLSAILPTTQGPRCHVGRVKKVEGCDEDTVAAMQIDDLDDRSWVSVIRIWTSLAIADEMIQRTGDFRCRRIVKSCNA